MIELSETRNPDLMEPFEHRGWRFFSPGDCLGIWERDDADTEKTLTLKYSNGKYWCTLGTYETRKDSVAVFVLNAALNCEEASRKKAHEEPRDTEPAPAVTFSAEQVAELIIAMGSRV